MKRYLNLNQMYRDKFWNFDPDEMNSYSDFLFARPSFMEGLSRALDVGNTLNHYNYSNTPEEADSRALWADWCTIGNDMRLAIYNVLQKYLNQKGYDRGKSR